MIRVPRIAVLIYLLGYDLIDYSDREIWQQFRASYKGKMDVHTRLMKRYEDIPGWWFHLTLVLSFLLSLVLCIVMKDQVQMPWWALIFASGLALIFTLPVSVITATTNQVLIFTLLINTPFFSLLRIIALLGYQFYIFPACF